MELAANTHADATLYIDHDASDNVFVVSLDSPNYVPQWTTVVAAVAQVAFAGKDVSFVSVVPSLWDVELSELSTDITEIQQNTVTYALAWAPAVSEETLQAAVGSTDFTLRALVIVAISQTTSARIHHFVAALHERDPLESIATIEEYLECIDDKWLYWYNGSEQHKRKCIDLLASLAKRYNWRIAINQSRQGA